MMVSVLVNNYNYAPYIDDCLQSISRQTYKNYEVIFYDDGSTDNSLQVAKKYDFVKIIANKNFGKTPPQNQANAINLSFKESKGDIICILDSDDFFADNKLEKIINTFNEDDEIVMVQHPAYIYTNNVTGVHDYSKKNINYKKLYYKKNWTGFFNPTSTLSFRRSYLNKVLPVKLDSFETVWPDARLSRIAPFYGKIISLNDVLSFYRKHNTNKTIQMHKSVLTKINLQRNVHEYINQQIAALGEKKLSYLTSTSFLFYIAKIIIPFGKIKRHYSRSKLRKPL